LKFFTAVTTKDAVFWDVAPCGFIKADVSEESVASIFRVEEITRARKSVIRLLIELESSYFFYSDDGGDTFLRNVGL
jgi:hypothetical protein